MTLLLSYTVDGEILEDEGAGISEDMLDKIRDSGDKKGDAVKDGGSENEDEQIEDDEDVDIDKYDNKNYS